MPKSLFLLIFLFSTSLFAVVQIAPNEVGLRPGFAGQILASNNTQRGNTDKDESSFDLIVSYDNNSSYVTWVEFSYDYGEAGGTKNENKAYAHWRFIHTLYSDAWVWEMYAQNEGDDFRNIYRRALGGAGLRWRFYEGDTFGRIYYGMGAYYESLEYTTVVDPTEKNVRMNNYVAYTKKLGEASRLTLSLYYHPKLDNWSDYYFHQTASLRIHIFEKLFVKIELRNSHDSIPAIGIEKTDLQQITSIGWKFGAKSDR